MTREFILKKRYINHFGLDFKSSDLVRADQFASSMKNAQYRDSGAIECRNGYQAVAEDRESGNRVGGFGLYSYNRFFPFEIPNSPVTVPPTLKSLRFVAGQPDAKLIALNRNAHVLEETTFSVQYVGTAIETILVTMMYDVDTDEFRFNVVNADTDTTLADIGLGKGINEATPYTIADLESDLIPLLLPAPDFVISTTGSTIPAAFMRQKRNVAITTNETASFDAYSWTKIRSNIETGSGGTVFPFDGSHANRNQETFENISSSQVNNVIYFSNGYDHVQKYDGSFLYRAGLPTPDTDVLDKQNSTSLFAQTTGSTGSSIASGVSPELFYSYKVQYEQRDNAGNIYESNVIQKTMQANNHTFILTTGAVSVTFPANVNIPAVNTFTGSGTERVIFFDNVLNTYITGTVQATGTTGVNVRLDPATVVNTTTGDVYGSGSFTSISIANGEQLYLQESINFTVPTVVNSRGFNTNVVLSAAGIQTIAYGGTINLTGTNVLKTGDIATFIDSTPSLGTTRGVRTIVIGSTSSSITVGEIVDMFTGEIISSYDLPSTTVQIAGGSRIANGLSIFVWRSNGFSSAEAAEAANHRLNQVIINDGSITTASVIDLKADYQIAENEILTDPLFDRSPPPKGKYLTTFRNQLIIANLADGLNDVAFSDEFPEYFPAGRNRFTVESFVGDFITGAASNNNVLCIFKDDSIHTVSGDLIDLNFRVEPLINDLGGSSHASIKEVNGQLYFMTKRGPYKMLGGQLPQSVGEQRIEPVFDDIPIGGEDQFSFRRAISFNDTDSERWILMVPTETETTLTDGDWKFTRALTRVFVCEYSRNDAWLEWSNYDISSGAARYNGELYFTGRVSNGTDIVTYLYRRLENNDVLDYEDHATAIDWQYDGNWEASGEPSVFKKFHRIRIFSLEENDFVETQINVKTEVNYIKDNAKSNFDFEYSALGYGNASYGDTRYGDTAEFAEYRSLAHGKFRSMRVRFSNAEHQQNAIITGWEIEISPAYLGKFKK